MFHERHMSSTVKLQQMTSVIMGTKSGGFCLVTQLGFFKFSGLWFTEPPNRHISPTNLSQAPCAPDRDLLNYSPYEGPGEHNVCYYAHPLGAGFHIVPPVHSGFSDPVISPGSLEHGCQFDSGS